MEENKKQNSSYSQSDIIRFRYKGDRLVIGEVFMVTPKWVSIRLKTNYFGKNNKWFEGEIKKFHKSEIRKLSILEN